MLIEEIEEEVLFLDTSEENNIDLDYRNSYGNTENNSNSDSSDGHTSQTRSKTRQRRLYLPNTQNENRKKLKNYYLREKGKQYHGAKKKKTQNSEGKKDRYLHQKSKFSDCLCYSNWFHFIHRFVTSERKVKVGL